MQNGVDKSRARKNVVRSGWLMTHFRRAPEMIYPRRIMATVDRSFGPTPKPRQMKIEGKLFFSLNGSSVLKGHSRAPTFDEIIDHLIEDKSNGEEVVRVKWLMGTAAEMDRNKTTDCAPLGPFSKDTGRRNKRLRPLSSNGRKKNKKKTSESMSSISQKVRQEMMPRESIRLPH